ncbi:MAG TPA: hypothetical protein DCQ50_05095 [Chryseobacterium sp.]|nr:hypothetical protein [Chryseobacterium sp.]
MLLPQNGRIVIIDDKESQAMPLIKTLSKHKFPFTYHSDDEDCLPNEPYSDLRTLFLDINLTDTAGDVKTIMSQLAGVLLRIVPENVPYILIVWSIKENDLFPEVEKLFTDSLVTRKPIVVLSLKKSDFFDYDPELGEILKDDFDVISEINKRLTSEIEKVDAFEALIKWENVIHISSSEVINEIISLASKKQNINDDLKSIYFKLAEAMWGRQLKGDAKEIALKAAIVFNQLLSDRLEFNVKQNLGLSIIKEIPPPSTFEEKDKAIFNSKLLLNIQSSDETLPGNVYEHSGDEIEKYPFNGLIADSILVQLVSSEFYESKNGKKTESSDEIAKYKTENKKEYGSYEKAIREKIKAISKFVSIEVSPICDYAQKKWKSNRVCPAILWHGDYFSYIGKSDNLYISPPLYIKDTLFHLVIDFRYFTAMQLDTFKGKKAVFQLKHSFLTDIQSFLARHIIRPGITSLN